MYHCDVRFVRFEFKRLLFTDTAGCHRFIHPGALASKFALFVSVREKGCNFISNNVNKIRFEALFQSSFSPQSER